MSHLIGIDYLGSQFAQDASDLALTRTDASGEAYDQHLASAQLRIPF
jgi:hypothetical protein